MIDALHIEAGVSQKLLPNPSFQPRIPAAALPHGHTPCVKNILDMNTHVFLNYEPFLTITLCMKMSVRQFLCKTNREKTDLLCQFSSDIKS